MTRPLPGLWLGLTLSLAGAGALAATSTAAAPPAPTLDVAALVPASGAEVAIYEVSVEGDSRRLEAVSILSAPGSDEGGAPLLRWQFYGEAFESPKAAYHVRLVSFFDLDRRDLAPIRVTRSFLTWEGGGCCFPAERGDGGRLVPEAETLAPLELGGGRFLPSQVPLLVRALDFPASGSVAIEVIRRDGEAMAATLELAGREPWRPEGAGEAIAAEKVVVRYERLDPIIALDALMLAGGAEVETYWREAGGNRQLLAMESGIYGVPMRMRLREETTTGLPAFAEASDTRAAGGSKEGQPSARGKTAGKPRFEPEFLALPLWDDGKAELAFYEVGHRGAEAATGLALSILVKHRYDPAQGRKVDADDPAGVDAFLALFLSSDGAPEAPVPTRRHHAVEAARSDLTPFASSVAEVTATDQCGALSRRPPGEPIEDRLSCHVRRPAAAPGAAMAVGYPVHQVPLLLRALDLGEEPASFTQELPVRLPDGRATTATVRHAGRETVTTPAGERSCDRLEVRYRPPSPPPGPEVLPTGILGGLPEVETYWREVGEHRQIVRVESGDRTLTLLEEIRSAHWAEDFYPRLERVTGRP